MSSKSQQQPSALRETIKSTVSGGVGGMCLVFAGHPLDTLKVECRDTRALRMQTMVIVPGQPPPYKNALDCAMQTVRREGPLALYKGMMGPLVGVTPMYAVCFFGYGVGKSIFTTPESFKRMSTSDVVNIGLAGALSGVFTTPIMAPMERVKCILQIQGGDGWKPEPGQRRYTGIMDCLRDTYRVGGISNTFRGFYATMLRDCTASFFYFSTYEFLRFHLNPKDGSSPGVLTTLFAGGMAGIMNWAGCLPIDTLKSRFQVAPVGKYKHGIRSVLREVLANEGPAALWRGATPIFLRAFPANAACFLGIELTLRVFKALDV